MDSTDNQSLHVLGTLSVDKLWHNVVNQIKTSLHESSQMMLTDNSKALTRPNSKYCLSIQNGKWIIVTK